MARTRSAASCELYLRLRWVFNWLLHLQCRCRNRFQSLAVCHNPVIYSRIIYVCLNGETSQIWRVLLPENYCFNVDKLIAELRTVCEIIVILITSIIYKFIKKLVVARVSFAWLDWLRMCALWYYLKATLLAPSQFYITSSRFVRYKYVMFIKYRQLWFVSQRVKYILICVLQLLNTLSNVSDVMRIYGHIGNNYLV